MKITAKVKKLCFTWNDETKAYDTDIDTDINIE